MYIVMLVYYSIIVIISLLMSDVFDEILVVEFYIEILVWCMWRIGGILLIVFEVVICGNIVGVVICVVFVIYILFFVIGFRNYGN